MKSAKSTQPLFSYLALSGLLLLAAGRLIVFARLLLEVLLQSEQMSNSIGRLLLKTETTVVSTKSAK